MNPIQFEGSRAGLQSFRLSLPDSWSFAQSKMVVIRISRRSNERLPESKPSSVAIHQGPEFPWELLASQSSGADGVGFHTISWGDPFRVTGYTK